MTIVEMKTRNKKEIEQVLTQREIEVLRLMASGFSRSDISKSLSISVLTYDEHRKNIRNKLGLRSHVDWALTMMPYMKK